MAGNLAAECEAFVDGRGVLPDCLPLPTAFHGCVCICFSRINNSGMSWFSTPADLVLRIRIFLTHQSVSGSVELSGGLTQSDGSAV
jgi:hypothetical protein